MTPTPEQARMLLNDRTEMPDGKGRTKIPGAEPPVVQDVERLGKVLQEWFREDYLARVNSTFYANRDYSEDAYFQIKDPLMMNTPWPNASAYRQPITAVLQDTLTANLEGSLFKDINEMCMMRGVGAEDKRTAPLVTRVQNWTMANRSDMFNVMSDTLFLMAMHGTSATKVMKDSRPELEGRKDFWVDASAIDIEHLLFPPYVKGLQRDKSVRVGHVIPMTIDEIIALKKLKISGKTIFSNMDKMVPGITQVLSGNTGELMRMDELSGSDISGYSNKFRFYWVEMYVTYWEPNAASPVELIVWFSPATGTVHRHIRNPDDGYRPFSLYKIYRIPDSALGMSLPLKVKPEQEKADAIDKQVTDAGDKAMMEPTYFEEGGEFDPELYTRIPGGAYPSPGKVTFDRTDLAPFIERWKHVQEIWAYAEYKTGLTEIFQGRQPQRFNTLGEAKLRVNRSEIRFRSLFNRVGVSWGETSTGVYNLIDRYAPRDMIASILGRSDYQKISEMFPQKQNVGMGLGKQYNWFPSGKPLEEIEYENTQIIQFVNEEIVRPSVAMNPASVYRLQLMKAKAMGIQNADTVLAEPPGAEFLGPEEAIQRIMSGQLDIQLDPSGVNGALWMTRLMVFARTDAFFSLSPEQQKAVEMLLVRVKGIQVGQMRARVFAMQGMGGMATPPGMPPEGGQAGG